MRNMRKQTVAIGLASLCISAWALAQPPTTQPASQSQPSPTSLTAQMDKVSYSLGLDIARQVKKDMPDASLDQLLQGIRDGMTGQARISQAEATQNLKTYAEQLQAKEQERAANPARANKLEGEAFLARNAREEGVKVTPSSLQYKILKQGDGPKPQPQDIVRVVYIGTLIDGTEFDRSHGRAASFRLDAVIPGWTEAIQMMPVGSHWMLYIPANLAYGERGSPPTIPPNATLIFDVELDSLRPGPPPPPTLPVQ